MFIADTDRLGAGGLEVKAHDSVQPPSPGSV